MNNKRKVKILSFFLLVIFPAGIYAATGNPSDDRDRAMSETFVLLEKSSSPPLSLETKYPTRNPPESYDNKKHNFFSTGWEKSQQMLKSGDAYLGVGAKIGYIQGDTTYDFDHKTSELEFPMNNWMSAGTLSLGFKDLSLNAEIWGQIEKYAGYDMKDKDWDSTGALTSYTKSKADMNALIWDVNLRYDFFKTNMPLESDMLILSKSDQITIGALAGYRHERFGYNMYELKYPDLADIVLYPGKKVLTYKIKYSLPYIGLVGEIANPKSQYGLSINVKYSFNATAEDQDNHILRYLTFYGDYDKKGYSLMGGISGFLKIRENWKLSIGIDGEVTRIKGTTWEEGHATSWDKDQDTDAKYVIFWSGIEYKF